MKPSRPKGPTWGGAGFEMRQALRPAAQTARPVAQTARPLALRRRLSTLHGGADALRKPYPPSHVLTLGEINPNVLSAQYAVRRSPGSACGDPLPTPVLCLRGSCLAAPPAAGWHGTACGAFVSASVCSLRSSGLVLAPPLHGWDVRCAASWCSAQLRSRRRWRRAAPTCPSRRSSSATSATRRRRRIKQAISPLHLHLSPLYLTYISLVSPLYLPQRGGGGHTHPNPDLSPNPDPNPNPDGGEPAPGRP